MPAADELLGWIGQAEGLMAQGDYDGAWALIARANDATFAGDGYEPLVKHYPNLAFARYYRDLGNWTEVQRYATSVASALDTDELAGHAYRTEAILLQGIAFYKQGESVQAEAPLRTAFRATEADPALARLHALASYYLAMLLTDLRAPEALDYRMHFFNLDLDGGPLTVEETAYLAYRHVFEARNDGAPAEQTLADFRQFMSVVDGLSGFNEIDYSFYRGFLGLAYAEAGEMEPALELFTERHDYLLKNGPIDVDFFWNVQRRAMLTSILGDNEAARSFLAEQIDFGRKNGITPFLLGILYRDMGQFSEEMGQTSVAQMHYRNAYSAMRSVLRANDPEVLAIKGRIDLTARDIKSFSFAPELGVVGDVDFVLMADAADVVRLFFEGRYLVLDAVLDAREAEEGGTALFLVNRAMQQALVGEVRESLVTLAKARSAVLLDPSGPVRPGAPVIDIVEAIGLVWSSAEGRRLGVSVLDRLEAQLPILSADERTMYYALATYARFQTGEVPLIPEAFRAWQEDWQKQPAERSVVQIAAATLALEAAIGSVPYEETDAVMKTTLADIERQGTMGLARDYIRMIDFLNGESAIFDENALTELGVLLRQIALQVPEDHSMVSASQFGMANALRWRGRLAEAFDWMRQATTTLRANPNAPSDTVAFLISEMAMIQSQLGDNSTAAALAREAYDMIDFARDRQDLSAGVIETYAYTTWQRTLDPARAAAIYARHADDPAYFDRLAPIQQVRMLRAYADAISATGDIERVRALLDRAEAAAALEVRDMRPEVSSLLWTRAIAEYYAQDYASAFGHIRRANDMGKEWQDDQLASGAFGDIGANEAHSRAIWEAAIGWEFAQTLPE